MQTYTQIPVLQGHDPKRKIGTFKNVSIEDDVLSFDVTFNQKPNAGLFAALWKEAQQKPNANKT